MKNMFFIPLILMIYTTTTHAIDESLMQIPDNLKLEKIAIIKNKNGEKVKISQFFLNMGNNQLLYIRDSSSPEALKHIEEICKSKNQKSDINYGAKIINGNEKYLISCTSKNILKQYENPNKKPIEETHQGYKDQIIYNQYGEKFITRTSELNLASGRKITIQQKFQEISPTQLLYIPFTTSPEVEEFYKEYCPLVTDYSLAEKGIRVMHKNAISTLQCINSN
ncbi:hypothetical protein [Acinetobacter stercoris]|uniref:Uncharacterized protein n=1 Tax=Acinetobacter stercoris TaxID=2126983 RepID=A0A2U3N1U0_9GAMM|nr:MULTISPECIES: hypothetical protein [Acinetobacter]SPL71656.1 hypothetical protein KPC_2834 [Acinetobacter stercoris]